MLKSKSLFVLLSLLYACQTPKLPENPDAWKKIKIDFRQLDAEGLAGQGSSKVAMNYEFCIPSEAKYWKEVQKIDPSARRNEGKGRVACKTIESLIIGSTHQKNYQRILFRLASLPYVRSIEPVFWE